jgi:hypothetical protein
MRTIIIVAAALLAGCAGRPVPVATEIKTVVQKVPVRARCPAADVYAALKATRPKPLASQPMPATAQERTARTTAQLGRYEAPGGWGDRAEAALDRCAIEEDLTPSP